MNIIDGEPSENRRVARGGCGSLVLSAGYDFAFPYVSLWLTTSPFIVT